MSIMKVHIVLTLALALVAASCKAPTGNNGQSENKAWVVSTLATGFSFPNGVAVDSSDNVYVADEFNQRIRKIEYKVP